MSDTASVPTAAAFAALTARVAALEHPVPPPVGVKAKRIHDLCELWGVNTFSTMDANSNVWGTWPSLYTPASVIAGLNYLMNNSGFSPRVREYHYAGRESFQKPWLQAIHGVFPRTPVSMCVGANGSAADVPSMVLLQADPSCGIKWLEGINEPNNDFGSGTVPVATTLAAQQLLWGTAAAGSVMGPSIVGGMPNPGGWVTGYCGASMAAMNAAMTYGNGHYYPPQCPDLRGSGTSIGEYVGSLWSTYAQHAIALTEYNSTLYIAGGGDPNSPKAGYYTLLAQFRAAKSTVNGLFWYAQYDWKAPGNAGYMACGLFPQKNADNPRPSAVAIHNLNTICADHGSPNFTPGSFPITVTGLDAQSDWDLYQASDGRWIVTLWRAANDVGGLPITVSLAFGSPVRQVQAFDPRVSAAATSTATNTASFPVALDNSARVLVIQP